MNADLGNALLVALTALAAVSIGLLLLGMGMTLLARLTSEAPTSAVLTADEAHELRARAASVAVAVALARRNAAPALPKAAPAMSPWQLALRTAQLTRWRARR